MYAVREVLFSPSRYNMTVVSSKDVCYSALFLTQLHDPGMTLCLICALC